MSSPLGSRNRTDPAALATGARPTPYELIKNAILAGDLEPDRLLTEVALAQWAGVSRTPIREALRRLEQDGLVVRTAQGNVVRSRSPEEILNIYETRIVLEAQAARVAAERRSDHDLRVMRWALARGQAADVTDSAQLVEANDAFHRAVWNASHNESLVDLLERLALHLARYPSTTLSAPGRWADALTEHAALTDAIERRSGKLAHRLAEEHFAAARDLRLQLFAREDLDQGTNS